MMPITSNVQLVMQSGCVRNVNVAGRSVNVHQNNLNQIPKHQLLQQPDV